MEVLYNIRPITLKRCRPGIGVTNSLMTDSSFALFFESIDTSLTGQISRWYTEDVNAA